MNQTKKRRIRTIPVLLVLLIAVSTFSAYRIHQLETAQEQLAYQAEAMYQRSFGELTDSIHTMNGQLAQLLVTSGQEQLLYGLSGLWREVYSAISSLGALPVAMHELEQTDLLLRDVAAYSYYLMRKNVLQQLPLSAEDWNRLEEFYRRTGIVQQELNRLETSILTEDFRLALLSSDEEDSLVTTAFRSIESQVTALPEIAFAEGVRTIEPELLPIRAEPVTEAEAIESANQFLTALTQTASTQTPAAQALHGELAFLADNIKLPVYGIAYPEHRYVEVSCAGGYVLQYYHTRPLNEAVLSADEAETQAYTILQQLQMPQMVCIEQKTEDTTANFIFVPQQDGVYLYPDMVKLQLALDDGTLLSFDQTSYQTRHHKRTLPAPKLGKEALLANRNPNFEALSIQPALITDPYTADEVLVYELRGKIVDETFSIFIDADTGQELRIVRL